MLINKTNVSNFKLYLCTYLYLYTINLYILNTFKKTVVFINELMSLYKLKIKKNKKIIGRVA